MNSYKYLRKSLDSKLDYSYSLYGGNDFLENYFVARKDAIQVLSGSLKQNIKKAYHKMSSYEQLGFIVFDKIFNRSIHTSKLLPKNYNDHLEKGMNRLAKLYLGCLSEEKNTERRTLNVSMTEEKGFVTEEILKLIVLNRYNGSLVKVLEEAEIIGQLSKKYEVAQRLFNSYDSSYIKTSEELNKISNYAFLGIIASDNFQNTDNLRYLNVLLKINDFLSGITCAEMELFEMLICLISLEKEISIIESLRRKVEKAG